MTIEQAAQTRTMSSTSHPETLPEPYTARRNSAGLPPLYVDLDGTFVKTDTLLECICRFIFPKLYRLFLLPFLVLKGRAQFKRILADSVDLAIETLPKREDLLSYLQQQSADGRQVFLATAADSSIAAKICAAYPLFDGFIASSDGVNLKGATKRDAIAKHAGGTFSYAGDSTADTPIFEAASTLIAAGGAAHRVAKYSPEKVEKVFPDKSTSRLKVLLKAMRLHQWVKNLLIVTPLVPLGGLVTGQQVAWIAIAIVCFGLIASSIYIANDLSDLEADRRHARKRNRPFASGALSITSGLLLSPALLVLGLVLAFGLVGWLFGLALIAYAITSTMYTTVLKRRPVFDVVTLAGLYTMRILAGAAAIQVAPSFWILGFSMLFFLSLASVKRYSELDGLEGDAPSVLASRGYMKSDLPFVLASGMSSAYAAVLLFSLYIVEVTEKGRFSFPYALWACCALLLLWISRTWFKTLRHEMHSDPVVFAVSDRFSQIVGALFVVAFAVTSYAHF